MVCDRWGGRVEVEVAENNVIDLINLQLDADGSRWW